MCCKYSEMVRTAATWDPADSIGMDSGPRTLMKRVRTQQASQINGIDYYYNLHYA